MPIGVEPARRITVAMALERMYVLDEGNIGRKLRNRTARLLGTDAASEQRIKDDVRELYDVRSDIIHNRLHRLKPERVHAAFVNGFDIARQSLFKLLREGRPEDWNASGNAGDGGRRRERGGDSLKLDLTLTFLELGDATSRNCPSSDDLGQVS